MSSCTRRASRKRTRGGLALFEDAKAALLACEDEVFIDDACDVGREPQQGPIIVQEFDSTILVPPGFAVNVDAQSNVWMTPGS